MSKKLNQLIENLKKAQEILAKDGLDDKIKAKMLDEMKRRNFGDREAADHMRDTDETIPAKQRTNIKAAFKQKRIKEEAPKPAPLKIVKSDDSVNDLIKRLQDLMGDDLNKSNYGPKGMGQYTPKDNIKRKMNNTGDVVGEGPNTNVKSFSTKPGQLSAKAQADLETKKNKKLNSKQPVKTYTKEEMAAMYPTQPLKMSQEDLDKEATAALVKALPKGFFGQPSNADFEREMIARGMGVSDQQVQAANQEWNTGMNNWFAEAMKPISSRFQSEEEEAAYWASIKVNGGSDNGPGY